MEKLKDFINSKIVKTKVSVIIITYLVLYLILILIHALGTNKHYDDAFISASFNAQKANFEDLSKAQADYNIHKKDKERLETEIKNTQDKINALSEFKEKQKTYDEEVKKLSEQVKELTSQKEKKEQELKKIEDELSKY